MIYVSLGLNIVVLIPVCMGLLIDTRWARIAWGDETPGRAILLSIYLAILLMSAALIFYPITTAVASLLAIQVIYKVTTPFTVKSFANPVVISNLGIAIVHIVTLTILWQSSTV